MYLNTPVSIRRARTSRAARSSSRSETQLHTRPCGSGCVRSRNRTTLSCSPTTSASAYSLNSCGHRGTSFVIAQTRSSGASIRTELSVCAAMSLYLRGPAVEVLDHGARSRQFGKGVVRDADAVLALHQRAQLQQGDRVVTDLFERRAECRDVRPVDAGVSGRGFEHAFEIQHGELGHASSRGFSIQA